MKKILIFILAIAVLSCEDFLEEVPKDVISSSNYFQDANDAEMAILGIYGVDIGNPWSFQMIELHSDYNQGRGSWFPMSHWDVVLDGTQIDRARIFAWRPWYQGVNRSNIVLDNVPAIDMDENRKKALLAEAHFNRAYFYFYLVRAFGPVPLRTEGTKDLEGISAPRAPEHEVYLQIIEDLTIAETDLPNSVGANTRRASKWAAKALLAYVYLTIEDWSNAAAKAEEVINSGEYSLLLVTEPDDFYDMFATTTHVEDIMSLHFSDTRQDALVTAFHRSNIPQYNNHSSGFFTLLPHSNNIWRNNWDDNDLRKSFNYYTEYVNAAGNLVQLPSATPVLFKKYITQDGTRSNSRPLLRYTEQFLIYAEAAAMDNGSPTELALERLNMIKRRGYGYNPVVASPVDYPDGLNLNDFRDAVLQERAYEFINEQRRWWDLLRTGTAKETIEASGQTFHEARLLWPIPQSEIDNNPALGPEDQNPYY